MLSLDRIHKTNDGKLEIFDGYPPIPVTKFIGQRMAVFGMSGAGKSFTIAVLCEEFTRTGIIHIIFDTEGDYTGLKDWMPLKYSLLRVFKGKFKEKRERTIRDKDGKKVTEEYQHEYESWDEKRFQHAVNTIIGEKVGGGRVPQRSVIVAIDRYDKDERLYIIHAILSMLWTRTRDQERKQAIAVIIDEAHEKIPQARPSLPELMYLIEDIAKLGRKQGLSLIISSQRPAETQKNVVAQCEILIMHKVRLNRDLDTYADYLSLSTNTNENNFLIGVSAPRLLPGECFYSFPTFDPEDNGIRRLKVRFRQSRHTTKTPGKESLVRW